MHAWEDHEKRLKKTMHVPSLSRLMADELPTVRPLSSPATTGRSMPKANWHQAIEIFLPGFDACVTRVRHYHRTARLGRRWSPGSDTRATHGAAPGKDDRRRPRRPAGDRRWRHVLRGGGALCGDGETPTAARAWLARELLGASHPANAACAFSRAVMAPSLLLLLRCCQARVGLSSAWAGPRRRGSRFPPLLVGPGDSCFVASEIAFMAVIVRFVVRTS
jgi:hypothetical protein